MKNIRKPDFRRRGPVEPEHRINHRIQANEVRVVFEEEPPRVLPLSEAIALALEQELDLVEISPNAVPPVCKIVNYQKFLYAKKKKEKELKSTQVKSVVKQVRLGSEIGDHDFGFKMEHAKRFLEEGNKVMALIFFRGRTIVYKERGEEVLKECIEALKDFGQVETPIRLEGKKMFMILAPLKKGK